MRFEVLQVAVTSVAPEIWAAGTVLLPQVDESSPDILGVVTQV